MNNKNKLFMQIVYDALPLQPGYAIERGAEASKPVWPVVTVPGCAEGLSICNLIKSNRFGW